MAIKAIDSNDIRSKAVVSANQLQPKNIMLEHKITVAAEKGKIPAVVAKTTLSPAQLQLAGSSPIEVIATKKKSQQVQYTFRGPADTVKALKTSAFFPTIQTALENALTVYQKQVATTTKKSQKVKHAHGAKKH